MGGTHDHGAHGHHGHGPRRASDRRRLRAALLLAASYMLAEVVGGLWTGSLALLADAGHMLADVSALALSLFALWFAERPAGPQSTFGHQRAEILAALANGVALVAIAFTIVIEAVERLATPGDVMGGAMLGIAAGGLAVNLAGLWVLSGGREGGGLNLQGAWLHVLADALGSVGAMAAGVLIWAFGWTIADPIASLVIAALVVYSAWSLIRDTVDVLMERAPRDVSVDSVRAALEAVDGVEVVHDLHVWTVTSGLVALSCHVAASERDRDAVLAELEHTLRERFAIHHSTIQLETPGRAAECVPCA